MDLLYNFGKRSYILDLLVVVISPQCISSPITVYTMKCMFHEHVLCSYWSCMCVTSTIYTWSMKTTTNSTLATPPQPSKTQHLSPMWKPTVHLLWASARWRSRPRTSSSGSSSVGLALCMVGQLGTSMLWQPRWRWLTEPCESVWSDFSDAGYSQPMQGKEG